MTPTRLACPHCRAVLKSNKALPAGKKITCVNCRQCFTYTPCMQAAGGDADDAFAFLLAETHAGTSRSPVAGMVFPAPETAASPLPIEAPALLAVSRPRRRIVSKGFMVAMGVLVVVGGGGALGLYLAYREASQTHTVLPEPAFSANPTKTHPTPQDPDPKPLPAKKTDNKKPAETIPSKKAMAPPKINDALINDAVKKGVRSLKSAADSSGSWLDKDAENAVGYAALPGLALLECKVAADDPVIQKAADFVRQHSARLEDTYDLGLAIVFLDRLGQQRDKQLIHTLALRLIAGQTSSGGWGYKCPILDARENERFLTFLKATRPKLELFDLLERRADNRRPEKPEKPEKPTIPKLQPARPLPPRLQALPIVAYQKNKSVEAAGRDDNSNTHFGLLGLWAARHHGVPVELCLALAAKRFQMTQRQDGGWGYVSKQPSKNTMTCVGLLGLAMGHGSITDALAAEVARGSLPKPPREDPSIKLALDALGQYVDGVEAKRGHEIRIDFYYLWALERVGMLYQQKTFGKKDWYRWGAEIILADQNPDGSWLKHYSTPVDTSFALLFLRRANWVPDLTDRLPLFLAIPYRERLQEKEKKAAPPDERR